MSGRFPSIGMLICASVMQMLLLSLGAWPLADQAKPVEQIHSAAKPTFDVVSIKHSGGLVPGRLPKSIRFKGDRLTCDETLARLVKVAYHLEEWEYSGPFWMNLEYYEVQAIAPPGTSNARIDPMLQSMLEERFGLQYHREAKQLPVYALLVGPDGLKLPPALDTPTNDHQVVSRTALRNNAATLRDLASSLTYSMDRPVLDMSGISGKFRINLDWSEAAREAAMRPGPRGLVVDPIVIIGALKQVGLRLEPRKSPVSVLIVDHVNKEPTAN